jgi:hypothetical protein
MLRSLPLRPLCTALAALAALALGASSARALSFNMDADWSGVGYAVKWSYGDLSRNWMATEFDATLEGVAGVAYCIDLEQGAQLGDTTGYSILDLDELLNGWAAAWLLQTYRADRDAPDARAQITALQIAIWEVTHDAGAWDIFDGDFRVLLVKSELSLALAQSYLASIPDRRVDVDGVVALHHNNNQDQIFIPNIPEPGTALLLGIGCAGIAFRGRRRR